MRLIDADLFAKQLDKYFDSFYGYGELYACSTIQDMLEDAPAVNPCEWISVEDRLPDEDVRVLVCIDSDRHYIKMDTDRILKGKWVRWSTYVTHWMPLPEPPK